ncbi:hypothetical protein [Phytomonospora endophytica]|uniref:Uncharacterized protein n=1 Tax=Phytomonospora endophytica TaxID=714109 RepID=A0A841FFH6_9ACTN|nr:hypothetical protein [Phytomonospora endophytica]MBB6032588.1 hypothetical protein [Phytomonospora endophytica]GIG66262.1 hypothetical protein Pen01_25570 [Phytomonospora endophytica]
MKSFNKIADRLLTRLVPPAEAQAAPCERKRQRCDGGSLYDCWYDYCQGFYLSCVRIGYC